MPSPRDTADSVKDFTAEAKERIDSAADQALEVRRHAGAVGGNFSKALDKSLKDEPYTTLFMVGILGFVLGALWKA
jgi:hypothetical protein